MPRVLHDSLLTEITRLESDHVVTFLFELLITGAPATLYYAAYDQDIFFHYDVLGTPFVAIPCQVETLEDASSASLAHIRVTFQGIDQTFVSLCENYWIDSPLWYVTIWQIDASQPDLVPYSAGELFLVDSITTDLWSATVDLAAEGLTLGQILPKRKYTRSSGYPRIPMRL